MPDRGKLVVLGFFLLAAVLAGGALWYHFAKTRWAMAYWGSDAARLIVRAPEVEVWQLSALPEDEKPSTDEKSGSINQWPVPSVIIDGKKLFINDRRPLAAAPGLIHMRMALIEDANFDTTAQQPTDPDWDYAFRFYSPEQELIVAIDSQHGFVRTVGQAAIPSQPVAKITPIATGLKRFLEEQFPEPGDGVEQNKKPEHEPVAKEKVPPVD